MMQYSIVNYSEVNGTFDFRIDGEYWHPKYLQAENKIENHKWSYLGNIAKIKGGKRLPLGETFSEHGIPYIRAEDVKYFVDYERSPKISNELHQKLARYQTQTNDILITIVGNSIGDVGFVKFDLEKCNFTENCAKLTDSALLPDYIFLFLISKYGQNQIHRETVGTAQPKLALTRIANFKVPILGKSLQADLQSVVTKSYEIWEQSKYQYLLSQTLLLSELGLTDWQPKHQLTFVKNYSDTEQAGRIDAEYYQPKYEGIIEAIKSCSGGWDTLENLVDLKEENFRPADKTEYKYIELANIAGNGEIAGCMIEQGQDLPSRARRKVATGDVIVSSIEGSLDSIALIDEEYDQALCSTGFYVVNSQAFNSETLLVLLKSIVGQLQLKKGCSGTILTAINKDEFGKVILPIIVEEKQAQIQRKVVESFRLRKQSKHLLECAKRAVEITIEGDEQTAIDYIENRTKEIGL